MMATSEKILLIRPDGLGDLILSFPVAETLKNSLPGCELSYLASSRAAGALALAPYVDGSIVDDRGDGTRLSLLDLADKIRREKFDMILELKSSWRTALAGYMSGVRRRIGTSRRFYSFLYSHHVNVHRRGSGFHQTDLELRLLQPLGIKVSGLLPSLTVTESGRLRARQILGSAGESYVVVHPGSAGSAPNWPMENYRALSRMILSETDLKVVVTDRGGKIAGFEGGLMLSGMTDIETLAAVIEKARIFVSGSTGPLHLADALGVRCMSFFANHPDIGPSRWGPRGNLEGVLTTSERCKCPRLRHCRCLERIEPDQAFNKLKDLIAKDYQVRRKS